MNKTVENLVIAGIIAAIGIIFFLSLRSCNNSKIQKDNDTVQQNDGEVLILKKQRTADSLHLIKDSINTALLTHRDDSLEQIGAKISLKYVYIYQALDTLSPKAKLELARKWLGNNIDSAGKLTNQGVQIVDSIKISDTECHEENANLKQQIAAKDSIISQNNVTINDAKDDINNADEVIDKCGQSEAALKNEVKALNHQITIKGVFGWIKVGIAIVAVVAVQSMFHVIK